MTIDQAIELLEITEDIDQISAETLVQKQKRARKRWHPDRRATADDATKKRYEENFKNIDLAIQAILQYQQKGYMPRDEDIDPNEDFDLRTKQKEETSRKQAPEWMTYIQKVWAPIKHKNWQITQKEVLMSDGFRLRDKLREDLQDENSIWPIVTIFAGFYLFIVLSIIGIFFPIIFILLVPAFLIHTILCFLLALPLSRIWLPYWLYDLASKSYELILKVAIFMDETKWLRSLIRYPWYFANGFSILILRPIYELAGYLWRDKVVGIKKRRITYFHDYETGYVDALLQKSPEAMNRSELKHLFNIYNKVLVYQS